MALPQGSIWEELRHTSLLVSVKLFHLQVGCLIKMLWTPTYNDVRTPPDKGVQTPPDKDVRIPPYTDVPRAPSATKVTLCSLPGGHGLDLTRGQAARHPHQFLG